MLFGRLDRSLLRGIKLELEKARTNSVYYRGGGGGGDSTNVWRWPDGTPMKWEDSETIKTE